MELLEVFRFLFCNILEKPKFRHIQGGYMPFLPVFEDQVADFEARLKVRLPDIYKKRLSDPNIQKILTHKKIGALDLSRTMQQFALFTEQIRQRFPDFPQDGVVISGRIDVDGTLFLEYGFSRFLIPDKRKAGQLGNMVYAWDASKRRKNRDCTIEESLDYQISCAPAELLQELGIAPVIIEDEPVFRIKSCDENLKSMLLQFASGNNPSLSDWILCTNIRIKGKYLVACDLRQVPDSKETPSIKISPGNYRVDVRLQKSRLGDWGIVAAVRVIHCDAKEVNAIEKFDLDVDLAAIAIYDRQIFFKEIPVDQRDFFCSELMDIMEQPSIAVAGAVEVVIIPTGDGDGTYPVYQLEANGTVVGMEIDFGVRHVPIT